MSNSPVNQVLENIKENQILIESMSLTLEWIDSIDTTKRNITKKRLREEWKNIKNTVDISRDNKENLQSVKDKIKKG